MLVIVLVLAAAAVGALGLVMFAQSDGGRTGASAVFAEAALGADLPPPGVGHRNCYPCRPPASDSGGDPVWLTPVACCFESAMTANCSAYDHRI